jgi:hypothetical protein
MSLVKIDKFKNWSDRAAKMRALAMGTTNKTAANLMSNLADDYEKAADNAKGRELGGK